MTKETRDVMKVYILKMKDELLEMYKAKDDEVDYIEYETFQYYWWKLKKLIDANKTIKKRGKND